MERQQARERELHTLGVGILSFTEGCELAGGIFITWGWDFLEARFLYFFFLIWAGVSCHVSHHLGPVWFDLASCEVRAMVSSLLSSKYPVRT